MTIIARAEAQPLEMTYTNWRGVKAVRLVFPIQIWFGSTEWHPEPQWFLKAQDIEKGQERDFAMQDIACFQACAVEQERTGITKGAFISAWSSALQKYWPEISDAEAIDMLEDYVFQEAEFGHPDWEWSVSAAEDLAKQYVDEYGEERSGERP